MSSRFLQKDFLRCGKCRFVHRYARGYKPIANPILFKAEEHCKNYFNERRQCAGYAQHKLTCRCPNCATLHSEWSWLDFQSYIREKERAANPQKLNQM